MSREVMARARVAVTLELELSQPWGGKCDINQVFEDAKRQAEEEVLLKIRKVGVRMVSSKVTAILVEEKRP